MQIISPKSAFFSQQSIFQVLPSDPEFHGRRGTASCWDILPIKRRNKSSKPKGLLTISFP